MDDREAHRQARRYVEERIVQVRCELALEEMCDRRSGDARELEEELLEELAELEFALLTGNFEPYVRWALPVERKRGDGR